MKTALFGILLTLCAPAFSGTIVEVLDPPENQAQILLNPPDKPYRVIAVISEEFKRFHSTEHNIKWLARKAKKLGADAIMPTSSTTVSNSAVVMPSTGFAVIANGRKNLISVTAIKYE